MHDLIGRIIGAVESITTTNSPSQHSSSTVNATTTTNTNDDSFVSPSRLYPVLLAVQCLLWELITTATINNSSSNSNTNSNTIVTSNNNTASNASSSSLFLSMSSTMNIITQQSVVALFSFMQRIDAFISLLDLERNFVNAASMHDLWMREMYIEKRYGSTQGNTNIDWSHNNNNTFNNSVHWGTHFMTIQSIDLFVCFIVIVAPLFSCLFHWVFHGCWPALPFTIIVIAIILVLIQWLIWYSSFSCLWRSITTLVESSYRQQRIMQKVHHFRHLPLLIIASRLKFYTMNWKQKLTWFSINWYSH